MEVALMGSMLAAYATQSTERKAGDGSGHSKDARFTRRPRANSRPRTHLEGQGIGRNGLTVHCDQHVQRLTRPLGDALETSSLRLGKWIVSGTTHSPSSTQAFFRMVDVSNEHIAPWHGDDGQ